MIARAVDDRPYGLTRKFRVAVRSRAGHCPAPTARYDFIAPPGKWAIAANLPPHQSAAPTASPQGGSHHAGYPLGGTAGTLYLIDKKRGNLPPGGSLFASISIKFHQKPCFSSSLRPISTPITDAIINPRVQPEESPRQCRPAIFVSRSVSILTLLE